MLTGDGVGIDRKQLEFRTAPGKSDKLPRLYGLSAEGETPGTGAPRGNRNARRHGRYSAQSREIQALGRILNRVADLARAQLAALEALACGDPGCIAIAEQRVSRCQKRLRQAALSLDRVLADRGDGEGRRTLIAGAVRLTAHAHPPRPLDTALLVAERFVPRLMTFVT